MSPNRPILSFSAQIQSASLLGVRIGPGLQRNRKLSTWPGNAHTPDMAAGDPEVLMIE